MAFIRQHAHILASRLDENPSEIMVLAGPRQVGKSTLIHQVLAKRKKRVAKKGSGTFKKGFKIVMDEVEFLIFLSKKSDFLDLRAEKPGYVGLKFGIIFLHS